MVGPPVHVSVCPSPALAVGWFGPRSGAPPAALVCWALVGSLLRRSVTLAFGRTLFLLLCLAGVGWDLGWQAAVLPGFLPFFGGELSFPCRGCFRLVVPPVWLSRLLVSFLDLFPGVLSSRFQFS